MPISFQSGRFYGALDQVRACGPFDIRAMAAVARQEDVELHTHEDAHFVLVLSGTYVSSARGAPAQARPPFLVFNPPGTTHRDHFAEGAGAFVTVSLPAQTLTELSGATVLTGTATPLDQPSAIALAMRMAREMRAAGDGGVLEAAGWELLGAAIGGVASGAPPAWAHLAYEAVMDQPTDARLTVGDIAGLAGVHAVHLARVFRQAWGCSPGELLRWRRAERAAMLLRRTTLPIAEVAAAAGFADQSHMTRALRSVYGVTPGAWRRAGDVARIQDVGLAGA